MVRLDPGEVSEWRVPWAKEEVVRSTKKKMGRAWGEEGKKADCNKIIKNLY